LKISAHLVMHCSSSHSERHWLSCSRAWLSLFLVKETPSPKLLFISSPKQVEKN